jgi:GT2 family glycosyltransferase
MTLSIVFVNYKSESLILDCLKSIRTYTKNISYEVIVIDNSFVKGKNKDVLNEFPTTIWKDLGYNAGFSIANNEGIKTAKGEFILFLNADTLLMDDSIEKALIHLQSNPQNIAVSAIQIDIHGNKIPYFRTQNEIRKQLFILPNSLITEKIINLLLPKERFQSNNETNNLVGAFLLVSKKNAIKSGQWDEDFFLYAEDVEFSQRLSKLGKLLYFDDVKIIHLINKNPYRNKNTSFVNRFNLQVQLSNLLWIRKSYGILSYLIIMINYWALLPIFWIWKIFIHISNKKSQINDFSNQVTFSKKVYILTKYLPKIIFLIKGPLKITEEENLI